MFQDFDLVSAQRMGRKYGRKVTRAIGTLVSALTSKQAVRFYRQAWQKAIAFEQAFYTACCMAFELGQEACQLWEEFQAFLDFFIQACQEPEYQPVMILGGVEPIAALPPARPKLRVLVTPNYTGDRVLLTPPPAEINPTITANVPKRKNRRKAGI